MTTIELKEARTRNPEWAMSQPVNFKLEQDEHIAIIGRNGSGKTMFVDMLTGRHPVLPDHISYHFKDSYSKLVSDNIQYIAFRDTYGGDNDRTYFLQQRWNQMEIDEETPTVGQKLEEAFLLAGKDTSERRMLQRHLYQLFHMEDLLDKYIILLSSGELRKYKLTSSLFSNPKVLIMDNPFIGLDAETRDQLRHLLATLAEEHTLQLILVLSKSDEIPEFITHVVEVRDKYVLPKTNLTEFLACRNPFPLHVLSEEKRQQILALPYSLGANRYLKSDSQEVIAFNHVTVRYGSHTILRNLDWRVMNGQHWVLSGQNGAGKSTLLSLVCADNPQGYACDITLFGRKRGSGESIWEVKSHIGYVSPEMHRSFQRDVPSLRIVASGLKDSVALYVHATPEELEVCRFWMYVFGIEQLADRSFVRLSSGEQRLVLLARAFVKDPELLILDEPLHGLDNTNRRLVKDVIETFCKRQNKTLIFVSHYKEERPACIDHEVFLKRQK